MLVVFTITHAFNVVKDFVITLTFHTLVGFVKGYQLEINTKTPASKDKDHDNSTASYASSVIQGLGGFFIVQNDIDDKVDQGRWHL